MNPKLKTGLSIAAIVIGIYYVFNSIYIFEGIEEDPFITKAIYLGVGIPLIIGGYLGLRKTKTKASKTI